MNYLTSFSHVKNCKLKMPSPFVSTDFKLLRVTRVLQRKEVLDVPSVNFGLIEDARLLDKQRFWCNVGFRSGNLDELDTKDAAVVDEESRGLLFQRFQGDHVWGPSACACCLETVAYCTQSVQSMNFSLLQNKASFLDASVSTMTTQGN